MAAGQDQGHAELIMAAADDTACEGKNGQAGSWQCGCMHTQSKASAAVIPYIHHSAKSYAQNMFAVLALQVFRIGVQSQ